jgi:manganese/zinc/iron transport system permease protein
MWSQFKSFLLLSDINTLYVVLGTILLASSTAVVGCFTMLRNRSLLGDAVAHAVLPGICLSFMITGSKNPIALLIGSFITGWLSLITIDFLSKKTKLKEDSVIASILSVFFGIGIVLLTHIQQSGNASQSGLDKYLFGQAASLVGQDLIIFASVAVALIITIVVFFKEFKLISFDANLAKAIGLPVAFLEILLTSLTVMAVVVGIQAVGVVLMAAMLITPAAAARFFTNKLPLMMVLAAIFGAIAGFSGSFISYAYPAMPTGPWIVLVISIIAFSAFFLAPGKGVFFIIRKQYLNKQNILHENVLKLMYHIGEKANDFTQGFTIAEMQAHRQMDSLQLSQALAQLRRSFYLRKLNDRWFFTEKGETRGKRVVKLHRLWEMYLSQYLNLPADHIHDDAETMEHIITPQIELWLEEQLNYPKADPHGEKIPY